MKGIFALMSQSQNDGRPVYRQGLAEGGRFLFHEGGGNTVGTWVVAAEIGAPSKEAKLRSASQTAEALSGEWTVASVRGGVFTIGAFTCCVGPADGVCVTGAVVGVHTTRYSLARSKEGLEACAPAVRKVVVQRGVTIRKNNTFAECEGDDLHQ